MSRRRGRPPRKYNITVRTQRRDPIDIAALARAALEQAAIDQRARRDKQTALNQRSTREKQRQFDRRSKASGEEDRYGYLE